MMRDSHWVRSGGGTSLVCALVLLSLACGEPNSAPGKTSDPKLVECPTAQTLSATGTITPLVGGTIAVGGSSVVLPVGAVSVPTVITLTVPASSYVEVELRANGLEHLVFALPLRVTIDYSRCTRTDINQKPLAAWHIDTDTKALLEDMHGTDDKSARTVTFTTGHFSSYAIAQ